MRLLDRYIGSAVAGNVAVVMLVLLALYFFSTLVEEMGDVGKGSYTTELAIKYTLMLIPRQVYELFPLSALLGAMLGLGSLASTSELTVMRAAGVSIRRIVLSVLKVGALLAVIVTLIGEVVAPPLEVNARQGRTVAIRSQLIFNTDEGLWAREGESFINIRRQLGDGEAVGVRIYRFEEKRLVQSVYAGRGSYGNDEWILKNATVSRVDDDGVSTRSVKQFRWATNLTPAVIDSVSVEPDNLPVVQLYDYIQFMRANGLEDRRYDLAMWIRIMTPLATAGMVLLAVPFVFGSMRSTGVGQRIMVGALIGIGFYLFNAVFSRVGILYNIPPLVAAALPTALVFALWIFLMRRIR